MTAFYRVLATVFFALAMLGVVLPLLPTTPFLLLTSWCLVRSSPRLHARLHASALFGPLLRDWERYRGVRPHVKATAVGSVVVAVTASIMFGRLSPPLIGLVIGLAGLGLFVIWRLPVVRDP